jgi:Mg-chelatase subunit ChlD
MSWIDSSDTNQWPRIAWAKLAALKFFDIFDSLAVDDRVSVMGWTSSGTPSSLADTANTSLYYQGWLSYTSDINIVRTFLCDSMFIDSTGRYVDTFDGITLVIRDNIPGANFTRTPLRISSMVAMQRLAQYSQPNSVKALIMLTDGSNNDDMDQSVALAFIDSLRDAKKLQYFGIGFMGGDTAELRLLSNAGGGNFYNATNGAELDSAYASLARQLINVQIDTSYSTKPILVKPDTVFVSNDVVLAVDLSGSMKDTDGSGRWRIAWTKIAALGFLDSLKSNDRIAVMGWTGSSSIRFADTANTSRYYKRWCYFTSQFDEAKTFILNDIFTEGSLKTDTINGMTMVIQNDIPSGTFGATPMRISSVVASTYISQFGRPDANKLVIMLTDGVNNDGEPRSVVEEHLDMLKRTQGIQFHTIGFMQGNPTELNALATAGGGIFINAQNSTELQNAYASLANMMILEKVEARKLTIQEVLQCPPLYYIEGSQKATDSSTVGVESFDAFPDAIGNTVMRWNFKNIRAWGKAEVSYRMIAVNGGDPMIGIDSIHSQTGFWSHMVYTDPQSNTFKINLKPSGGTTPVTDISSNNAVLATILFSERRRCVLFRTQEKTDLELKLYTLNGKVVYSVKGHSIAGNNWVRINVPSHISAGVYITCVSINNTMVRKKIYLDR